MTIIRDTSARALPALTRRWGASLIIAAMVATTLTATVVSAPAMAADPTNPEVTVDVTGAGQVLAGASTTLTIRAANPSLDDGFNLGVYLDLPAGTVFESSSMGTPTVFTSTSGVGVPAGTVRWVWEDVSDLPSSGAFTGSLVVTPPQPALGSGENSDTSVFPVGATFAVTGSAFLSGDATYLPVFGGSSGVATQPAIDATAASDPAPFSATMVSLLIEKNEPSPESELLRGVHTQSTLYSITLRNTSQGANNNPVLVDYIPAGLEFLGCGGVDNSLPVVEGDTFTPEYEGAPSLDQTPGAGANCSAPVSVTTVISDGSEAPGLVDGAVYTRVEWHLDALASGEVRTVTYRAGIPLRENTMTFTGGDPAAPYTPDSTGAQASNLDNNTGPSTRQGSVDTAEDGDTWTNVATATSTYAGVTRTGTGTSIQVHDSETVHAMDLAVTKDVVGSASFVVGERTTYALTLRASEYMDSSEIVLTDTIPNGLCPIVPAAAVAGSWPADCPPGATVVGGSVLQATANADGTFTVLFEPTGGVLAADGVQVITYEALNRDTYVNGHAFGPTTSGDGFANAVEVAGVTDAITVLEPSYPDSYQVWDDSDAQLGTDLTSISKLVMSRNGVEADLADGVDPCTDGSFSSALETGFQMGDTVCFELKVDFPDSVQSRNPVVTDFLPAGLEYAGHSVASASDAHVDSEVRVGGRMTWRLGTDDPNDDSDDLYVPRGATFIAHVWATVTAPSNGPDLDKPANLMKYRQQNVDGELFFLRDEAAVEITPELQLVKGVQSILPLTGPSESARTARTQDAADGNTDLSNRDGIRVTEGEEITYRVDLSGTPFDVSNTVVWDLLPAGIVAADVSAVTDGGTALNPGDPGYPTGKLAAAHSSRSVIVWNGVDVPGDTTKTLTYVVTIPTPMSVSTALENTASIISYAAGTNSSTQPDAQEYIPAGSLNVDPSVTPNTDGAGTRDNSDVFLPGASIAKARTSPTATNNTDAQVVPGEYATFTYSATIPAHTSVIGAILSDTFATAGNWTIDPTKTVATLDGGVLPTGFTLTATNGTLTFPATYTNDTATDQVFAVTVEAAIRSSASWVHSPGTSRSDTARFSGTGFTALTATANVRLIEPQPTIDKTVDQAIVTAGQTVEYTLRANNTSGRPTSFGTVVTDCVPEGLGGVTVNPLTSGDVVVNNIPAPADCIGTLITWTIGDLAANANLELKYTATVDPLAAGGKEYPNTARIKGYSLEAAITPEADRREYNDTDAADITVRGTSVEKTVDQPTATIGETRDYAITIELPADVNFYDVAIIDDVPAGMSIGTAIVTCEFKDSGDDCLNATHTPGMGAPLATADSATGVLHGWWIGDVPSNPEVRVLTVTYTGTVLDDVDSVKDSTLTNTASGRWNSVSKIDGPPPSADYETDNTTNEDDAVVTVVEPTLGVAKKVNTLDSDTVAPGTPFDYEVTVTNTGNSTAYGATVTDTVPAGVIVTTISNGGVLTGNHATTGGGVITWNNLTIANGTPLVLTYQGAFAASINLTDDALTNVVDVGTYYSLPAGNPERREYDGPDADAVVTPLFPEPEVVKAATGTIAYIGEEHEFTLTLKNTGTGLGTNVTLVDVLPAGFTYVADSAVITPGSDDNPTISGQTLTWSALDDIAADGTTIITYRAVASSGFSWSAANTGSAFPHTNGATLTMDDTSGAPANKDRTFSDDTDATVYIHRADLAVDKTHVGHPVAGTDTTWTLTVTNVAGDPAVGPIVITDTLPADAVYVGISGDDAGDWDVAGPDQDNVLVLTHAGPLAAGDSLTVDVTASFDADIAEGTDATNRACAASSTFESATANNCFDDPDAVVTLADLEISKIANDVTYVAGEGISWDLEVHNNGPSDSQAPIRIVDTLPDTVKWDDSATGTGTGWVCGDVDASNGELECTWNGAALEPGDDLPIVTISATVKSGTTGTVFNTATVFPTTDEPTKTGEPTVPGTWNNTDTATTGNVNTIADLEIIKTVALDAEDEPVKMAAGDTGRYRLEVTNYGPSDALNVRIVDTLPAGLTYAGGITASSGDTWTCVEDDDDAQQVNCTLDSSLGTLVSGVTTWLEFDVSIASDITSTIVNSATVSSDTPEPDQDPHPNTDTVETEPFVQTNLALAKTHAGDKVYRAGDEVTFTLTVTNVGNADAQDVSITDAIPAGTEYVRVENRDGWTVTDPTDTDPLTLTLDAPLVAGDADNSASFDVVVRLTADAVPSVTNVAEVSTSTDETTLEDNEATDTVVVDSPDLVIVKSASATSAQGEDVFSYSLNVTNADPRAFADNVSVTDVIDANLAVLTDPATIGGDDWDCTLTGVDDDGFGGTLDCALNTLAAGASASVLTFDVKVAAGVATDNIANTATVASPDEHPSKVDDGNSSTVTIPVLWIELAAQSVCVADVPRMQATFEAHNVAQGLPITLTWFADADGDQVPDGPAVAVQTLNTTTAPGVQQFSTLWPGAAVDGDGVGIAWPGWRAVRAGETPEWQNMIADPKLPSYALRAGALVKVSINPEVTVSQSFSVCATPRPVQLDIDKTVDATTVVRGATVNYTLNVTNVGYGATNDVVVTDPIADYLKVTDITVEKSTSPEIADWKSCTVSGTDADGYGGTVECVLDGWIGHGQASPSIVITAQTRDEGGPRLVTNTASVTWSDPDASTTDTQSVSSAAEFAVILTPAQILSATGVSPAAMLWAMLALLGAGGALVLIRRRGLNS